MDGRLTYAIHAGTVATADPTVSKYASVKPREADHINGHELSLVMHSCSRLAALGLRLTWSLTAPRRSDTHA